MFCWGDLNAWNQWIMSKSLLVSIIAVGVNVNFTNNIISLSFAVVNYLTDECIACIM